ALKVSNAAGTIISHNTISDTGHGGAAGNPADGNVGGSAILITHSTATNTVITGNQIGPNSGYGIRQVDSAGASTGTIAQFNAIVGNTLGGVSNGDLVPAALIDARKNWWGATSGPSGPGLAGTGDLVSANVLIDSFGTS